MKLAFGIGPDYWNINKRWRLCSAGRKQSPIDIPTDRLVYDHLLGPLQFAWLPAQASALNEAQRFEEKFEQVSRGGWLEAECLPSSLLIDCSLPVAHMDIYIYTVGSE